VPALPLAARGRYVSTSEHFQLGEALISAYVVGFVQRSLLCGMMQPRKWQHIVDAGSSYCPFEQQQIYQLG
jgi:hypothetical protein